MKETGQVYSPESRDLNLDEEDESPDIKGNILDFVLRIGVLIALTIVSGATLGSHACFYSDATVLTSSCCKMNNMDHALSQLPYAMCAAGIATAGYLICGFLL